MSKTRSRMRQLRAEAKARQTARGTPPTKHVPKIILTVRRGSRREFSDFVRCAGCGGEFHVLWHYSSSNRGPVLLCSLCKVYALEDSFPRVDAASTAVSGGRFEGNRRRH
jgi:hypothetical protein